MAISNKVIVYKAENKLIKFGSMGLIALLAITTIAMAVLFVIVPRGGIDPDVVTGISVTPNSVDMRINSTTDVEYSLFAGYEEVEKTSQNNEIKIYGVNSMGEYVHETITKATVKVETVTEEGVAKKVIRVVSFGYECEFEVEVVSTQNQSISEMLPIKISKQFADGLQVVGAENNLSTVESVMFIKQEVLNDGLDRSIFLRISPANVTDYTIAAAVKNSDGNDASPTTELAINAVSPRYIQSEGNHLIALTVTAWKIGEYSVTLSVKNGDTVIDSKQITVKVINSLHSIEFVDTHGAPVPDGGLVEFNAGTQYVLSDFIKVYQKIGDVKSEISGSDKLSILRSIYFTTSNTVLVPNSTLNGGNPNNPRVFADTAIFSSTFTGTSSVNYADVILTAQTQYFNVTGTLNVRIIIAPTGISNYLTSNISRPIGTTINPLVAFANVGQATPYNKNLVLNVVRTFRDGNIRTDVNNENNGVVRILNNGTESPDIEVIGYGRAEIEISSDANPTLKASSNMNIYCRELRFKVGDNFVTERQNIALVYGESINLLSNVYVLSDLAPTHVSNVSVPTIIPTVGAGNNLDNQLNISNHTFTAKNEEGNYDFELVSTPDQTSNNVSGTLKYSIKRYNYISDLEIYKGDALYTSETLYYSGLGYKYYNGTEPIETQLDLGNHLRFITANGTTTTASAMFYVESEYEEYISISNALGANSSVISILKYAPSVQIKAKLRNPVGVNEMYGTIGDTTSEVTFTIYMVRAIEDISMQVTHRTDDNNNYSAYVQQDSSNYKYIVAAGRGYYFDYNTVIPVAGFDSSEPQHASDTIQFLVTSGNRVNFGENGNGDLIVTGGNPSATQSENVVVLSAYRVRKVGAITLPSVLLGNISIETATDIGSDVTVSLDSMEKREDTPGSFVYLVRADGVYTQANGSISVSMASYASANNAVVSQMPVDIEYNISATNSTLVVAKENGGFVMSTQTTTKEASTVTFTISSPNFLYRTSLDDDNHLSRGVVSIIKNCEATPSASFSYTNNSGRLLQGESFDVQVTTIAESYEYEYTVSTTTPELVSLGEGAGGVGTNNLGTNERITALVTPDGGEAEILVNITYRTQGGVWVNLETRRFSLNVPAWKIEVEVPSDTVLDPVDSHTVSYTAKISGINFGSLTIDNSKPANHADMLTKNGIFISYNNTALLEANNVVWADHVNGSATELSRQFTITANQNVLSGRIDFTISFVFNGEIITRSYAIDIAGINPSISYTVDGSPASDTAETFEAGESFVLGIDVKDASGNSIVPIHNGYVTVEVQSGGGLLKNTTIFAGYTWASGTFANESYNIYLEQDTQGGSVSLLVTVSIDNVIYRQIFTFTVNGLAINLSLEDGSNNAVAFLRNGESAYVVPRISGSIAPVGLGLSYSLKTPTMQNIATVNTTTGEISAVSGTFGGTVVVVVKTPNNIAFEIAVEIESVTKDFFEVGYVPVVNTLKQGESTSLAYTIALASGVDNYYSDFENMFYVAVSYNQPSALGTIANDNIFTANITNGAGGNVFIGGTVTVTDENGVRYAYPISIPISVMALNTTVTPTNGTTDDQLVNIIQNGTVTFKALGVADTIASDIDYTLTVEIKSGSETLGTVDNADTKEPTFTAGNTAGTVIIVATLTVDGVEFKSEVTFNINQVGSQTLSVKAFENFDGTNYSNDITGQTLSQNSSLYLKITALNSESIESAFTLKSLEAIVGNNLVTINSNQITAKDGTIGGLVVIVATVDIGGTEFKIQHNINIEQRDPSSGEVEVVGSLTSEGGTAFDFGSDTLLKGQTLTLGVDENMTNGQEFNGFSNSIVSGGDLVNFDSTNNTISVKPLSLGGDVVVRTIVSIEGREFFYLTTIKVEGFDLTVKNTSDDSNVTSAISLNAGDTYSIYVLDQSGWDTSLSYEVLSNADSSLPAYINKVTDDTSINGRLTISGSALYTFGGTETIVINILSNTTVLKTVSVTIVVAEYNVVSDITITNNTVDAGEAKQGETFGFSTAFGAVAGKFSLDATTPYVSVDPTALMSCNLANEELTALVTFFTQDMSNVVISYTLKVVAENGESKDITLTKNITIKGITVVITATPNQIAQSGATISSNIEVAVSGLHNSIASSIVYAFTLDSGSAIASLGNIDTALGTAVLSSISGTLGGTVVVRATFGLGSYSYYYSGATSFTTVEVKVDAISTPEFTFTQGSVVTELSLDQNQSYTIGINTEDIIIGETHGYPITDFTITIIEGYASALASVSGSGLAWSITTLNNTVGGAITLRLEVTVAGLKYVRYIVANITAVDPVITFTYTANSGAVPVGNLVYNDGGFDIVANYYLADGTTPLSTTNSVRAVKYYIQNPVAGVSVTENGTFTVDTASKDERIVSVTAIFQIDGRSFARTITFKVVAVTVAYTGATTNGSVGGTAQLKYNVYGYSSDIVLQATGINFGYTGSFGSLSSYLFTGNLGIVGGLERFTANFTHNGLVFSEEFEIDVVGTIPVLTYQVGASSIAQGEMLNLTARADNITVYNDASSVSITITILSGLNTLVTFNTPNITAMVNTAGGDVLVEYLVSIDGKEFVFTRTVTVNPITIDISSVLNTITSGETDGTEETTINTVVNGVSNVANLYYEYEIDNASIATLSSVAGTALTQITITANNTFYGGKVRVTVTVYSNLTKGVKLGERVVEITVTPLSSAINGVIKFNTNAYSTAFDNNLDLALTLDSNYATSLYQNLEFNVYSSVATIDGTTLKTGVSFAQRTVTVFAEVQIYDKTFTIQQEITVKALTLSIYTIDNTMDIGSTQTLVGSIGNINGFTATNIMFEQEAPTSTDATTTAGGLVTANYKAGTIRVRAYIEVGTTPVRYETAWENITIQLLSFTATASSTSITRGGTATVTVKKDGVSTPVADATYEFEAVSAICNINSADSTNTLQTDNEFTITPSKGYIADVVLVYVTVKMGSNNDVVFSKVVSITVNEMADPTFNLTAKNGGTDIGTGKIEGNTTLDFDVEVSGTHNAYTSVTFKVDGIAPNVDANSHTAVYSKTEYSYTVIATIQVLDKTFTESRVITVEPLTLTTVVKDASNADATGFNVGEELYLSFTSTSATTLTGVTFEVDNTALAIVAGNTDTDTITANFVAGKVRVRAKFTDMVKNTGTYYSEYVDLTITNNLTVSLDTDVNITRGQSTTINATPNNITGATYTFSYLDNAGLTTSGQSSVPVSATSYEVSTTKGFEGGTIVVTVTVTVGGSVVATDSVNIIVAGINTSLVNLTLTANSISPSANNVSTVNGNSSLEFVLSGHGDNAFKENVADADPTVTYTLNGNSITSGTVGVYTPKFAKTQYSFTVVASVEILGRTFTAYKTVTVEPLEITASTLGNVSSIGFNGTATLEYALDHANVSSLANVHFLLDNGTTTSTLATISGTALTSKYLAGTIRVRAVYVDDITNNASNYSGLTFYSEYIEIVVSNNLVVGAITLTTDKTSPLNTITRGDSVVVTASSSIGNVVYEFTVDSAVFGAVGTKGDGTTYSVEQFNITTTHGFIGGTMTVYVKALVENQVVTTNSISITVEGLQNPSLNIEANNGTDYSFVGGQDVTLSLTGAEGYIHGTVGNATFSLVSGDAGISGTNGTTLTLYPTFTGGTVAVKAEITIYDRTFTVFKDFTVQPLIVVVNADAVVRGDTNKTVTVTITNLPSKFTPVFALSGLANGGIITSESTTNSNGFTNNVYTFSVSEGYLSAFIDVTIGISFNEAYIISTYSKTERVTATGMSIAGITTSQTGTSYGDTLTATVNVPATMTAPNVITYDFSSDNYTWSVDNNQDNSAELATLPSFDSGKIVVYINVFENGTLIATKTVTFNLSPTAETPVFTLTADNYSAGKYVAGQTISATLSATQGGSTYTIPNSITYTFNSPYDNNVEANNITALVKANAYTVTITASVTIYGKTFTETITVTVEAFTISVTPIANNEMSLGATITLGHTPSVAGQYSGEVEYEVSGVAHSLTEDPIDSNIYKLQARAVGTLFVRAVYVIDGATIYSPYYQITVVDNTTLHLKASVGAYTHAPTNHQTTFEATDTITLTLVDDAGTAVIGVSYKVNNVANGNTISPTYSLTNYILVVEATVTIDNVTYTRTLDITIGALQLIISTANDTNNLEFGDAITYTLAPIDITGGVLTYYVSDTNLAEVNSSTGEVTFKPYNAGSYTVSVWAEYVVGGAKFYSNFISLNVSNPQTNANLSTATSFTVSEGAGSITLADNDTVALTENRTITVSTTPVVTPVGSVVYTNSFVFNGQQLTLVNGNSYTFNKGFSSGTLVVTVTASLNSVQISTATFSFTIAPDTAPNITVATEGDIEVYQAGDTIKAVASGYTSYAGYYSNIQYSFNGGTFSATDSLTAIASAVDYDVTITARVTIHGTVFTSNTITVTVEAFVLELLFNGNSADTNATTAGKSVLDVLSVEGGSLLLDNGVQYYVSDASLAKVSGANVYFVVSDALSYTIDIYATYTSGGATFISQTITVTVTNPTPTIDVTVTNGTDLVNEITTIMRADGAEVVVTPSDSSGTVSRYEVSAEFVNTLNGNKKTFNAVSLVPGSDTSFTIGNGYSAGTLTITIKAYVGAGANEGLLKTITKVVAVTAPVIPTSFEFTGDVLSQYNANTNNHTLAVTNSNAIGAVVTYSVDNTSVASITGSEGNYKLNIGNVKVSTTFILTATITITDSLDNSVTVKTINKTIAIVGTDDLVTFTFTANGKTQSQNPEFNGNDTITFVLTAKNASGANINGLSVTYKNGTTTLVDGKFVAYLSATDYYITVTAYVTIDGTPYTQTLTVKINAFSLALEVEDGDSNSVAITNPINASYGDTFTILPTLVNYSNPPASVVYESTNANIVVDANGEVTFMPSATGYSGSVRARLVSGDVSFYSSYINFSYAGDISVESYSNSVKREAGSKIEIEVTHNALLTVGASATLNGVDITSLISYPTAINGTTVTIDVGEGLIAGDVVIVIFAKDADDNEIITLSSITVTLTDAAAQPDLDKSGSSTLEDSYRAKSVVTLEEDMFAFAEGYLFDVESYSLASTDLATLNGNTLTINNISSNGTIYLTVYYKVYDSTFTNNYILGSKQFEIDVVASPVLVATGSVSGESNVFNSDETITFTLMDGSEVVNGVTYSSTTHTLENTNEYTAQLSPTDYVVTVKAEVTLDGVLYEIELSVTVKAFSLALIAKQNDILVTGDTISANYGDTFTLEVTANNHAGGLTFDFEGINIANIETSTNYQTIRFVSSNSSYVVLIRAKHITFTSNYLVFTVNNPFVNEDTIEETAEIKLENAEITGNSISARTEDRVITISLPDIANVSYNVQATFNSTSLAVTPQAGGYSIGTVTYQFILPKGLDGGSLTVLVVASMDAVELNRHEFIYSVAEFDTDELNILIDGVSLETSTLEGTRGTNITVGLTEVAGFGFNVTAKFAVDGMAEVSLNVSEADGVYTIELPSGIVNGKVYIYIDITGGDSVYSVNTITIDVTGTGVDEDSVPTIDGLESAYFASDNTVDLTNAYTANQTDNGVNQFVRWEISVADNAGYASINDNIITLIQQEASYTVTVYAIYNAFETGSYSGFYKEVSVSVSFTVLGSDEIDLAELTADKVSYKAGETITLTLNGVEVVTGYYNADDGLISATTTATTTAGWFENDTQVTYKAKGTINGLEIEKDVTVMVEAFSFSITGITNDESYIYGSEFTLDVDTTDNLGGGTFVFTCSDNALATINGSILTLNNTSGTLVVYATFTKADTTNIVKSVSIEIVSPVTETEVAINTGDFIEDGENEQGAVIIDAQTENKSITVTLDVMQDISYKVYAQFGNEEPTLIDEDGTQQSIIRTSDSTQKTYTITIPAGKNGNFVIIVDAYKTINEVETKIATYTKNYYIAPLANPTVEITGTSFVAGQTVNVSIAQADLEKYGVNLDYTMYYIIDGIAENKVSFTDSFIAPVFDTAKTITIYAEGMLFGNAFTTDGYDISVAKFNLEVVAIATMQLGNTQLLSFSTNHNSGVEGIAGSVTYSIVGDALQLQQGTVKAIGTGEARVYATYVDSNYGAFTSALFTITVENAVTESNFGFTVNGNGNLEALSFNRSETHEVILAVTNAPSLGEITYNVSAEIASQSVMVTPDNNTFTVSLNNVASGTVVFTLTAYNNGIAVLSDHTISAEIVAPEIVAYLNSDSTKPANFNGNDVIAFKVQDGDTEIASSTIAYTVDGSTDNIVDNLYTAVVVGSQTTLTVVATVTSTTSYTVTGTITINALSFNLSVGGNTTAFDAVVGKSYALSVTNVVGYNGILSGVEYSVNDGVSNTVAVIENNTLMFKGIAGTVTVTASYSVGEELIHSSSFEVTVALPEIDFEGVTVQWAGDEGEALTPSITGDALNDRSFVVDTSSLTPYIGVTYVVTVTYQEEEIPESSGTYSLPASYEGGTLEVLVKAIISYGEDAGTEVTIKSETFSYTVEVVAPNIETSAQDSTVAPNAEVTVSLENVGTIIEDTWTYSYGGVEPINFTGSFNAPVLDTDKEITITVTGTINGAEFTSSTTITVRALTITVDTSEIELGEIQTLDFTTNYDGDKSDISGNINYYLASDTEFASGFTSFKATTLDNIILVAQYSYNGVTVTSAEKTITVTNNFTFSGDITVNGKESEFDNINRATENEITVIVPTQGEDCVATVSGVFTGEGFNISLDFGSYDGTTFTYTLPAGFANGEISITITIEKNSVQVYTKTIAEEITVTANTTDLNTPPTIIVDPIYLVSSDPQTVDLPTLNSEGSFTAWDINAEDEKATIENGVITLTSGTYTVTVIGYYYATDTFTNTSVQISTTTTFDVKDTAGADQLAGEIKAQVIIEPDVVEGVEDNLQIPSGASTGISLDLPVVNGIVYDVTVTLGEETIYPLPAGRMALFSEQAFISYNFTIPAQLTGELNVTVKSYVGSINEKNLIGTVNKSYTVTKADPIIDVIPILGDVFLSAIDVIVAIDQAELEAYEDEYTITRVYYVNGGAEVVIDNNTFLAPIVDIDTTITVYVEYSFFGVTKTFSKDITIKANALQLTDLTDGDYEIGQVVSLAVEGKTFDGKLSHKFLSIDSVIYYLLHGNPVKVEFGENEGRMIIYAKFTDGETITYSRAIHINIVASTEPTEPDPEPETEPEPEQGQEPVAE